MRRVVLVGGGHAHAVVLLGLARHPLPQDAKVALITPDATGLYSGMLPGVVAGHYAREEAEIDIGALARKAGAFVIPGAAVSLDPDTKTLVLDSGDEITYDTLSLDVGSVPDTSIPGSGYAVPVKKVLDVSVGEHVAVIGAGAGGAEIAMALRHRGHEVALYGEQPLEPRIARALRHRGVSWVGMAVSALQPGPVVLSGASSARYDTVLLATGGTASPWLAASGLAADDQGFVLVDDSLKSVSHPDVFAVGDCATLRSGAHPRSGVFAVRHGAVLERNLRGEARPFRPQRRSLMLLACGERYAIAQWGDWSAEGRWVWRWKDWIDRRWVERFKV